MSLLLLFHEHPVAIACAEAVDAAVTRLAVGDRAGTGCVAADAAVTRLTLAETLCA